MSSFVFKLQCLWLYFHFAEYISMTSSCNKLPLTFWASFDPVISVVLLVIEILSHLQMAGKFA